MTAVGGSFRAPVPWFPLPARLAVLLSGRGSNFEALADACDSGALPARIVLVLSDRADAAGLEKARARGIAAAVEERGGEPRAAHEARLAGRIRSAGTDVVCLAGFMRVLSPAFVERFERRIVNVHPSLLPAFPGLEAQRQAFEHGVKVAGATVHLVDAGTDTGPIAGQEAVPVRPGEDAANLAARILEAEHRLYPATLAALLDGGWVIEGRCLRFPAPGNTEA
ncbi:MAG TPA: phosphoribosylglycinamide formyltransferase [Thermoanaerobaculia bacterium]|nr:phosphoribosylglycinamide formyltransferase [Thermoanaerobaculia bacterium]